MTQERHAYMIMAHHKFEILEKLLLDLDDKRNDIFLHIDAKSKNFHPEEIKAVIKNAQLYFTERMDIRWGGYSQIACVMMLLKKATAAGYHSYYHFMVGVEFPLKDQAFIHDFFAKNSGYEFIGFDNLDTNYIDRIRYYHPFNKYARNNNFLQKILNKIRIACVAVQKILHVNRVKKYKMDFKKGNANWSITHDLATYVVSQEKMVEKIYLHSFCGDEVFLHSLVYNSEFWKNVYDKEDEYHSSMRIMTWTDPHNQYHLSDLDNLLNSGRLFARKIDGEDAIELIDAISKNRMG